MVSLQGDYVFLDLHILFYVCDEIVKRYINFVHVNLVDFKYVQSKKEQAPFL